MHTRNRPPADAYHTAIIERYQLAGPLMEASFGGDPIVYANCPSGFDSPRLFGITEVPLSAPKRLLVRGVRELSFPGPVSITARTQAEARWRRPAYSFA